MQHFLRQLCFVLLTIISLPALAQQSTWGTWNLEWLTINPNNRIYEGKRDAEDFAALAKYFELLDADVIALQEVDSQAAMERVSSSQYSIVLSDRATPSFLNHQYSDTNQYTGFAIKHSIPFTDPSDIDLYSKRNHKLRFAAYVILYPDSNKPIHLLSVHLKAGCVAKFYDDKSSCQKLLEQGNKLNQWILEREQKNQEYVVMGDFNHNLSYNGDWLWSRFTQGLNHVPTLATRNTSSDCKVRKRNNPKTLHQFRSIIDHIIVSKGIRTDNAHQQTFTNKDVLDFHLSDHCPIVSQFHW